MLYYVVSMCHACCLLLVLLGRFEDFEVPSSKVSVNFIVRIERFLEDCWLAGWLLLLLLSWCLVSLCCCLSRSLRSRESSAGINARCSLALLVVWRSAVRR